MLTPAGEELIYLDPHTTQPAVEPFENGEIQDDSYHCQHPPCRMHICELDPSIAVVSNSIPVVYPSPGDISYFYISIQSTIILTHLQVIR